MSDKDDEKEVEKGMRSGKPLNSHHLSILLKTPNGMRLLRERGYVKVRTSLPCTPKKNPDNPQQSPTNP